ncbi:hypothetical protein A2U01_0097334, partial [Trifolium medium]|nr:hypothetical protein [Trifolium medium]
WRALATTGDQLAQRPVPLAQRPTPEFRLRLETCLDHAQIISKSSIHHGNNQFQVQGA